MRRTGKRAPQGPFAFLAAMILSVATSSAQPGAAPQGETGGQAGAPVRGPAVAMAVPELGMEGTEHLIDVGGRKIHAFVYGAGAPTIVLLSGFNAPQTYWNGIISSLAERTTVVTYDRAGYGRSEIGGLPLDGAQSARDLHALLKGLGAPRPYLVVGHSYGVDVARLFGSAYPDDLGGLVLLDGQHEDVLDEQRKVLEGEDRERLEEMVVMMASMAGTDTEIGSRQVTVSQLKDSGPLPEVPLIVITAGDRSMALPPVFSEDARAKLTTLGVELQQKLVALIPGGRHVIAEGAGHNIHVQRPELVISSILDVVDEVRGTRE